MNKTLAAIVALGAVAFGGCEQEEKPMPVHKPVDVLIIDNNECKPACGGEICYNVTSVRQAGQSKAREVVSYRITSNGFDRFTIIDKSIILADECIFYRQSAGAIELVLEQLR